MCSINISSGLFLFLPPPRLDARGINMHLDLKTGYSEKQNMPNKNCYQSRKCYRFQCTKRGPLHLTLGKSLRFVKTGVTLENGGLGLPCLPELCRACHKVVLTSYMVCVCVRVCFAPSMAHWMSKMRF